MPVICALRDDVKEYLEARKLSKKWEKAKRLFEQNPDHPSLHTELMEPRHRLIYSFRIDKKYRALFICIDEWSRFSERNGVDLIKVINAIKARPTHSNIIFGGYCLPKDGGLGVRAYHTLKGCFFCLSCRNLMFRLRLNNKQSC